MKNLFPFPRPFLLALAVAFVALLALSTHQLVRAGTASAFAGLVIACTGMLAVLIVAALDQVVDVLKPLLKLRVESSIPWTPLSSPPLTHRQNLEQGIANEVVRAALTPGFSSHTAGQKARTALDSLMGAAEPVPAKPAMPAAAVDVEALIQSAGLTAPRVTPADIEANIVECHYINAGAAVDASWPDENARDERHPSLGQLTICVLVLRNGTKVVGVNYGAIDPARHDAEQGRTEARAAAVEQVWPLMGYELRTKLAC